MPESYPQIEGGTNLGIRLLKSSLGDTNVQESQTH